MSDNNMIQRALENPNSRTEALLGAILTVLRDVAEDLRTLKERSDLTSSSAACEERGIIEPEPEINKPAGKRGPGRPRKPANSEEPKTTTEQ